MSISVAPAAAPPVDILVTNAEMQPIVVEVKNKEHLTREDAVRLFRDLTAYAALPAAPYVLVISQEVGFLWKDPLVTSPMPPPLEFPMDEVIGRYVPDISPSRRLRPQELQVASARWLLQLTGIGADDRTSAERMLRDVGFIAALEGAIVIPNPYA